MRRLRARPLRALHHRGILGLALLLAGCGGGLTPPAAGPGAGEGAGPTALGPEAFAYERVIDPFPVRAHDGEPYTFPFLGGFDVPRPQFVDIDGDGDQDLFLQERSSALIFFENVGESRAPEFRWRTDRYADLEVGEWSRFADLDQDGDFDLLAEEIFSYVRMYRNDGTASEARFVLVADTLRAADGTPIFSDRQNIPNVVDIDCDGQLDLFLGRADGTVTRYEEGARGRDGVPVFQLVAERFEDISIVAQIMGGPPGSSPSLHGANSMSFIDIDEDGDQDMLWGDFFEPGVLLLENTGDCETPNFRQEPGPIPTVGEALLTSGYNATVPVDINGDGRIDLAVGVLGGAFNPNRTASDNFQLWMGSPEGLRFTTGRFLPQVDVGSESVPALGDIDGDGDLDLLVGNKLDPTVLLEGRVYHFENQGTASDPQFVLTDTLALGAAYHLSPVFGDLDADGDLDLVVGTWQKGVRLHRNVGSRSEPAFEEEGSTLVELTRGSNSTPGLADVDGDGDLDLMVGEATGELNFYRNEGTPAAHDFVLVSDVFQEIDVGRRSHPSFLDVDGDGDPDLVVGREEGGVALYLNHGAERFEESNRLSLPLFPYSAPTYGDLDGDGWPEIVAGTRSGGLLFFRSSAAGPR